MVYSDKAVTYGIIGVGLMGMEHINNLLRIPNARVVAVADTHLPSIIECRRVLHLHDINLIATTAVFDNSKDLFLANTCDVVIIATPNHTHHKLLMQAYNIGNPDMHILVEKPLCTTVEHCREVNEAAQKRPGKTFVGLEYSFIPPITTILNHARKGMIGIPRMVAIREHRFPFLKKVGDWNRFSKNSGGTFVEKCCHFFDLFNRVLSPQTPVQVFASGGQDVNHLDEEYDGEKPDILDNGFVVVQYSGGSRACLDLCMFAESSQSQEEISIVGSKGKLEAFLPQLEVRVGIRNQDLLGHVRKENIRNMDIQYEGHHHGSSYLEHVELLKVVASGGEYIPSGQTVAAIHQGFLSMAIGVAAQMSIDQNRLVQMKELLSQAELENSIVTCLPED